MEDAKDSFMELGLFFVGVVHTFSNWPVYLLDTLGLLTGRMVEYRSRDGVRLVTVSDRLSRVPLGEIWVSRNYNPPGFEIGDRDLVVDIGANVGAFSVYAAKRAPRGLIYAYEPDRESFVLLERNVHLNGFTNVVASNLAISVGIGEGLFYSGGTSIEHSLMSADMGGSTVSYVVRTIGLMDIFKINNLSYIDFLKVDCEGSEYDILFGTNTYYLSKIEKIVLEYHEGRCRKFNRSDLVSFLGDNGFVTKVRGESDRSNGLIYAKNKSSHRSR